MRYLYSEYDMPVSTDYYYEARYSSNDVFPYVPAHTHDYYEIYMYLDGSCRLAVEDNVFEVQVGDIIVIPPFTIHQLFHAEPYKLPYVRMFMYITETCLKTFQFNEHNLLNTLRLAANNKRYHFKIQNNDDYNTIRNCMKALSDNMKTDFHEQELFNRGLILLSMSILNKNIVNELAPTDIIHTDPHLEKIIAYINSNYTEEITLNSLADMFYINKSTLSKDFKDYTSHTIHNYLLMKRLSVAKQEMGSGTPPSQVYITTGFKDYSTFYRSFLRNEGMSPRDYFNLVSNASKDNKK